MATSSRPGFATRTPAALLCSWRNWRSTASATAPTSSLICSVSKGNSAISAARCEHRHAGHRGKGADGPHARSDAASASEGDRRAGCDPARRSAGRERLDGALQGCDRQGGRTSSCFSSATVPVSPCAPAARSRKRRPTLKPVRCRAPMDWRTRIGRNAVRRSMRRRKGWRMSLRNCASEDND